MSPEEIKKLIGGYATGTLTPEEQQALFAAALDDQELFDALAREQSLRDLLRDPAARAELLSALDTPARGMGGFWQWLRRPAVAGLVTAGVAGIAIVAVWQGMRTPTLKQEARYIAVEDLPRERPTVAAPAPAPPPPTQMQGGQQGNATAPSVPTVTGQVEAADKKAAEPAPTFAALKDQSLAEKEKAAPAPLPAPATPQAAASPAPAVMARKAEADAVQGPPLREQISGNTTAVSVPLDALDARALFYGSPLSSGVSGFVETAGGGGAAPAQARQAVRTDPPAMAKSVGGLFDPTAAQRLGVRVSILRGDREVDIGTVLDPGETVRLKLIPNADGFLNVREGVRTVASGPAQRLKSFETPELHFDGSGQRPLVITLSRTPLPSEAIPAGNVTGGNVVSPSADQGRATYVVTGANARQVVVPVTLTYR